MARKGHLLLNNIPVNSKNFDPNRTFAPDNDREEKNPETYANQKNRFSIYWTKLLADIKEKSERRTIDIPEHIEYIRINFYKIFKNDIDSLKNKFINEFGLSPVLWRNFNQTVLFAISDEKKFVTKFIHLLNQFVGSPNNVSPRGKEYAVLILVESFELLTYSQITADISIDTTDITIHLVNSEEAILLPYESIQKRLNIFLDEIERNEKSSYKYFDEKLIEVKNIDFKDLQTIADNFDIIHKISSGRVPTVKPSKFSLSVGEDITWDIEVNNDDYAPFVGVIDTGVRKIDPLAEIVVEELGIDKTNSVTNDATVDMQGHGTMVASLVAMGESFFDISKKRFTTAARIVPIKILSTDTGETRISDIESAIRQANSNGVYIFNLSVNSRIKAYNQEYSEYAYILDKLAYELSIIIFISAGNLDFEDAKWMQDQIKTMSLSGMDYSLLDYPNHFYNPHKQVDMYTCDTINLQEPAESLNNMTVGAIADNLESVHLGLAITKDSPAFYSRKFYFDYSRKVNGSSLKRTQKNYNIFKPDIVMPGGDYIQDKAGMKVISLTTDFYAYTAGTSLSAPLATHIAAKIAKLYPDLSMQSVKALIINSSKHTVQKGFFDVLIEDIKRAEAAIKFPGKSYHSLNAGEKRALSNMYDSETLMNYVSGHGKPVEEECLFSSDKKVTIMVQDEIAINNYKAIKISIPKELLDSTRRAFIVSIDATLCYSFPPVLNNHLAYNPLHISFTLYRTVHENDYKNLEILSSQKDHDFFEFNKIQDGLDPKSLYDEKEKIRAEKIGIKTKQKPWSEDMYPYKAKPFSNVQKLDLNITKDELLKVDGSITLMVRATAKVEDIDSDIAYNLQNNMHQFSIALSFEEFASDLEDFSLYEGISDLNSVTNIINIDNGLSAEIDL